MISFSSFSDELEKISYAHAAELAGLGILAAPSVAELAGKKVDERKKAGAEVAGLGILAAPSLHHYGSKALKYIKKASVDYSALAEALDEKLAAAGMDRMMQQHALIEGSRQAAPAAAASPKPVQRHTFGREVSMPHSGGSGLDLAHPPKMAPPTAAAGRVGKAVGTVAGGAPKATGFLAKALSKIR